MEMAISSKPRRGRKPGKNAHSNDFENQIKSL